MACERATLYGLVVYSQRRINYGPLNPSHAREIFIREALVGGEYETRAPFFAHNQKLIREIENLEHKSRRLDVLVDDELISAFYDKLIPADVTTARRSKSGATTASVEQPKLLYLVREELMRHEAAGVTTDLFPEAMTLRGKGGPETVLGLSYHFEPGSPRDGVTMTVPLFALNQIDPRARRMAGARHAEGKGAPAAQVTAAEIAPPLRAAARLRGCLRAAPRPAQPASHCSMSIIADVREHAGAVCQPTDFKVETLPAHHFMNFKVVDEHGRQLGDGPQPRAAACRTRRRGAGELP